jgi:hypothetical protein
VLQAPCMIQNTMLVQSAASVLRCGASALLPGATGVSMLLRALSTPSGPTRAPRQRQACVPPAALVGARWAASQPAGASGGHVAGPAGGGGGGRNDGTCSPGFAATAALVPPRVKGIGRKMVLRQVGRRAAGAGSQAPACGAMRSPMRERARRRISRRPAPCGARGPPPPPRARSPRAHADGRQVNRSIVRRLARRFTVGIPVLGLYFAARMLRRDSASAAEHWAAGDARLAAVFLTAAAAEAVDVGRGGGRGGRPRRRHAGSGCRAATGGGGEPRGTPRSSRRPRGGPAWRRLPCEGGTPPAATPGTWQATRLGQHRGRRPGPLALPPSAAQVAQVVLAAGAAAAAGLVPVPAGVSFAALPLLVAAADKAGLTAASVACSAGLAAEALLARREEARGKGGGGGGSEGA